MHTTVIPWRTLPKPLMLGRSPKQETGLFLRIAKTPDTNPVHAAATA